jgi:hypothetical protein
MSNTYVVTGTLTDATTIQLDEALPVSAGKVRLIVEPSAPSPPQQSLEDYLADLRKRQAARGHVPMTVEEVEAYLKAERESWGD